MRSCTVLDADAVWLALIDVAINAPGGSRDVQRTAAGSVGNVGVSKQSGAAAFQESSVSSRSVYADVSSAFGVISGRGKVGDAAVTPPSAIPMVEVKCDRPQAPRLPQLRELLPAPPLAHSCTRSALRGGGLGGVWGAPLAPDAAHRAATLLDEVAGSAVGWHAAIEHLIV